ncbi:fibronectin type III domain-containing protein [Curtobacterium flaccumfaciens pv. flaccumfaciens]
MYRALITAVAAAALVFGGAVPATAHTSPSVPGAPTAVRVTGDADTATLTWRGPKHGAKVTGWKVAVAAVANRHDRQVDRLHPRARSDRFDELSPATTYRFSVRALGHRGDRTHDHAALDVTVGARAGDDAVAVRARRQR